MATIAGVVAAVGSAAASGYAASQQGKGARGAPKFAKAPLPPALAALQHYNARILALNEMNQPPSFSKWLGSGGTAQFPIQNTGFTPMEARHLGIIGPRGGTVPFVNSNQNTLTPEQQLYLGFQQATAGGGGPLAKAYRENKRLGRLEGLPQTDARQAREAALRSRRDINLGQNVPGTQRLF